MQAWISQVLTQCYLIHLYGFLVTSLIKWQKKKTLENENDCLGSMWRWLGRGLEVHSGSDSNILCVDGAFITQVLYICQTNVHFGYPHLLSRQIYPKKHWTQNVLFLLITKTFYFLKLGKDKFGLHENPPQYPFNYIACMLKGSSVCCFYHVHVYLWHSLWEKALKERHSAWDIFISRRRWFQITMCCNLEADIIIRSKSR